MKKVILTQPNYAWLGKRAWQMPPYTLALLNACLMQEHDVKIFDPNYHNVSEKEVLQYFRETQPEIVGISSISTEYIKTNRLFSSIIKEGAPHSIVVQGGIIPTVGIESAMKDPNVDYWIIGEGEFRFLRLLNEIEKSRPDLSSIDGLAYWKDGAAIVNPPNGFINDLDSIPYPDYGNRKLKFSQGLLPRNYPYAVTVTSRGSPYRCIFCAASSVSSRKIRFRSADNVLNEIE